MYELLLLYHLQTSVLSILLYQCMLQLLALLTEALLRTVPLMQD
jgi:hypothetical protein